MDLKAKLKEIIPPNNRDHREGFRNNKLINDLSDEEKQQVEVGLID